MFRCDEPYDTLTRMALISIPVDNEIYKLDLVDDNHLGIWFTDSKLPSIVLLFDEQEHAIKCLQDFKRSRLKCRMKVVKGDKDENSKR